MASLFTFVETPAFMALVAGYVKDGHKKLPEDVAWLAGRLAEAPEQMGDHVPGLKKSAAAGLQGTAKTVATGSVRRRRGASHCAIHEEQRRVFLLFLHHKKEYEKPAAAFLVQKMERALIQHPAKALVWVSRPRTAPHASGRPQGSSFEDREARWAEGLGDFHEQRPPPRGSYAAMNSPCPTVPATAESSPAKPPATLRPLSPPPLLRPPHDRRPAARQGKSPALRSGCD